VGASFAPAGTAECLYVKKFEIKRMRCGTIAGRCLDVKQYDDKRLDMEQN